MFSYKTKATLEKVTTLYTKYILYDIYMYILRGFKVFRGPVKY